MRFPNHRWVMERHQAACRAQDDEVIPHHPWRHSWVLAAFSELTCPIPTIHPLWQGGNKEVQEDMVQPMLQRGALASRLQETKQCMSRLAQGNEAV